MHVLTTADYSLEDVMKMNEKLNLSFVYLNFVIQKSITSKKEEIFNMKLT